MNRVRAVLLARLPRPGRVKTRLARDLGPEAALAIYRALLADTLARALASGLPLAVAYDPPDASEEAARAAFGPEPALWPQAGPDLGARMAQALARALSDADAAMVLGADIPELSSGLLKKAAGLLSDHDAVLGPSRDGGYYLLGLAARAFSPALFRDMPWGTDLVLGLTGERLARAGLSVARLPVLADLDTAADLPAPGAARGRLGEVLRRLAAGCEI